MKCYALNKRSNVMYNNHVSPLIQGIVCNMFDHPKQWKIGKSKRDLANFDREWVLDIRNVGHGEVKFHSEVGQTTPSWSVTVEDSRALCIAVRDWVFDNVKCKEPI